MKTHIQEKAALLLISDSVAMLLSFVIALTFGGLLGLALAFALALTLILRPFFFKQKTAYEIHR